MKWVWGLVVGWGGCECDGFGAKHFVIVNVSHINPSLNGQPQSSVFQSHCVCCHFNQCVCAAVLSHFCPFVPSPFSLMIGFVDDVIAEQPSHPCLVIHNTVHHVIPLIFLSSESWLKQCVFMTCLSQMWMDRFLLLHALSLASAFASAFSHGATFGSREMMAPRCVNVLCC